MSCGQSKVPGTSWWCCPSYLTSRMMENRRGILWFWKISRSVKCAISVVGWLVHWWMRDCASPAHVDHVQVVSTFGRRSATPWILSFCGRGEAYFGVLRGRRWCVGWWMSEWMIEWSRQHKRAVFQYSVSMYFVYFRKKDFECKNAHDTTSIYYREC